MDEEIAYAIEDPLRMAGLQVVRVRSRSNSFPAGVRYVAVVKGRPLGKHYALIRADHEVCRLLAWLPFPQNEPIDVQLKLTMSLLSLNFAATFGRVSVGPSTSQTGTAKKLYLETVYFWKYARLTPDLFAIELNRRLEGFANLLRDVVGTVSSSISSHATASPSDETAPPTG